MDSGLLATVVTGGAGIVALCISRFKCLVHCTRCCHFESCKFGFLDSAIVGTHAAEFRLIASSHEFIFG